MDTPEPTPLTLAAGLRSVIDPEVGLNVVDLGLIYDLRVEDGEATVRLTMTTPACPMSNLLRRQVGGVLQRTPGLRRGVVELVWDPPWSPDMVEPAARDASSPRRCSACRWRTGPVSTSRSCSSTPARAPRGGRPRRPGRAAPVGRAPERGGRRALPRRHRHEYRPGGPAVRGAFRLIRTVMAVLTRPADGPGLLHEARSHLDRARDRLDASPPAHTDALGAVLASFRASLLAHLAWYGVAPEADAPLTVLAERAVRNDSVLKTVAHRAVLLAERATAIERSSSRPTVHDREDVETGWYTARNLLQTVEGRLAPSRRSP